MKKLAFALVFIMIFILPKGVGAEELTLRPNADGVSFGWSGGVGCTAGSYYECVNETVQDGDTTYLYTTSAGNRDYYLNIEDSTQTRFISNVTVYQYLRTLGNELATIFIYTGATQYLGTEYSLTTSYVLYSESWPTNPNTLNNWTWSDINSLQVGTRSSNSGGMTENRVTQIWVNVTFGSLYDSRDPAPPNSTGGTWYTNEVLNVSGSGWRSNQVIDMKVNASDGSTICTQLGLTASATGTFSDYDTGCSLSGAATGLATIYVSTDGGATWTFYDQFDLQAPPVPEFSLGMGLALLPIVIYFLLRRSVFKYASP
jgi:hypothetical protein